MNHRESVRPSSAEIYSTDRVMGSGTRKVEAFWCNWVCFERTFSRQRAFNLYRWSQIGSTEYVDALRSNIVLRVGGYVAATIVFRTLVNVTAASGSRVRPASRAVGTREGSSGGV